MPAKRPMSAPEQQRYREILQAAAIGALMDSKRWEPGDIAFQGGTCLHLAHGSVRFSEDLDFMIRGGMSTVGLAKTVEARLQRIPGIPPDLEVTVSKPSAEEKNPRSFTISVGSPNVIGSAKVKVELWSTSPAAMDRLSLIIKPVSSPQGHQAQVPALTMDEILADKVYAIGARDRIKARDVFDLWWLTTQQQTLIDPEALTNRLSIYPTPSPESDAQETACAWMTSAQDRLDKLRRPETAAAVSEDLKRWLPSYWKMDETVASEMIEASANLLQAGMEHIGEIACDGEGPGSEEWVRARG